MSKSVHSDCQPLIVDDDPDFTLLLRRGLGKVGIPESQIRSCVDGDEAVRLLSANQYLPSFILLDLQMPRRSGIEVLEWIRGTPSPLARVLVFMMTCNSEPAHVARAFDLGVFWYLDKPSESSALMDVLAEIVRCWQSNATPTVRRVSGTSGSPRMPSLSGSTTDGVTRTRRYRVEAVVSRPRLTHHDFFRPSKFVTLTRLEDNRVLEVVLPVGADLKVGDIVELDDLEIAQGPRARGGGGLEQNGLRRI